MTGVFVGKGLGHGRVISLARHHNIRLFDDPIHNYYDNNLISSAELLIVGGYATKIRPTFRYALNLHPTMLPLGRGPRPIPWVLCDCPDAAGMTLHQLTSEFDAGPIICQDRISRAETMSFEGYLFLCNHIAVRQLNYVLNDPEDAFRKARTQDLEYKYIVSSLPDSQRLITAEMTGSQITLLIRRLGPEGAILQHGGMQLRVTGADFIQQSTDLPYKAFESNSLYSAFRCSDGFIIFKPSDLYRLV